MIAVERVAATGVITIVLAAVFQHVVDAVFQALEAERGALLVAFGRMVEDHVEDHLDVGGVQRPDHLLELADLAARLLADGVAAVRREEAQRVVAPVVRLRRTVAEAVENGILVDRHQFDGRHAQRLQVGNLLDDAQVRAGMLDFAAGRLREAADVDFVDDRLGQAAAEVAIALPVELIVDDDTFWRAKDAALGRQKVAGQCLAIGVDEAGLGIEAIASQRFVGPVGLQVIKLPRSGAGHEDAPDVAPAVQVGIELDDVGRVGIVDALVEQDPHCGGVAAENDELHPSIVDDGPVGEGVSELQGCLPLGHGRGINGATSVEGNIRSIARTDIKRHLFLTDCAEPGEGCVGSGGCPSFCGEHCVVPAGRPLAGRGPQKWDCHLCRAMQAQSPIATTSPLVGQESFEKSVSRRRASALRLPLVYPAGGPKDSQCSSGGIGKRGRVGTSGGRS